MNVILTAVIVLGAVGLIAAVSTRALSMGVGLSGRVYPHFMAYSAGFPEEDGAITGTTFVGFTSPSFTMG